MNEVRFEFYFIRPNKTAISWGYRKSENAAKQRYKELQGWTKSRPHWKNYKVEVRKKVSTSTFHSVEWA